MICTESCALRWKIPVARSRLGILNQLSCATLDEKGHGFIHLVMRFHFVSIAEVPCFFNDELNRWLYSMFVTTTKTAAKLILIWIVDSSPPLAMIGPYAPGMLSNLLRPCPINSARTFIPTLFLAVTRISHRNLLSLALAYAFACIVSTLPSSADNHV